MKKDIIAYHIKSVPVHKDCDFQNNYVKIKNWLIKYKNFDFTQATTEEKIKSIMTDELIEEFEDWCDYYNVTPICIL